MPLKKSKPASNQPFLWSTEFNCFESDLIARAEKLAKELGVGDVVVLEGAMGAGKSTFARALLRALDFELTAEGSPSFALVHEYQRSDHKKALHIDLYRIETESELDDSGIAEQIWSPKVWVLVEWLSKFPDLENRVFERPKKDSRCWKVEIFFPENGSQSQNTRNIRVLRFV